MIFFLSYFYFILILMLFDVIFVFKLRERVAVYLLKLLSHPGLTDQQRITGDMFKVIMVSMNLQSLRLNSTDCKITCEEEVRKS